MKRSLITGALIFFLAVPRYACGYTAEDFAWSPYFLVRNEKPSVTIVLDNSESMLLRMHDEPFAPGREYSGYFDPKTYYSYRSGRMGPHFVPDDASGEWNGNFLNWALMTRLDIARRALTGGKFDHRAECFEAVGLRRPAQAVEYDDSAPVTDLRGALGFMTPHHRPITIAPVSEPGGMRIQAGDADERCRLHIEGTPSEGAIQAFRDKARMALFVFNGENGGKLLHPMSDTQENIQGIIGSIDDANVSSGSPLAETMHTAYGYLRQDATVEASTGPRYTPESYAPSGRTDPFGFPSQDRIAPCTRQSVILVTDGVSSKDSGIPGDLRELVPRPRPESEYELASDGTTYLLDIAHKGRTTDLRPEEGMDGNQSWSLHAVCVTERPNALLMDAVRYGNFRDLNGNGLPDLKDEFDGDNDGIPDGYLQAGPGQGLESAMLRAFWQATANPAAGSMTISTATMGPLGRKSDTVLYQAAFFPPSADMQSPPPWSGQIHAFFVDPQGNMREDTNENGRLDLKADRVIEFAGTIPYVHADHDGDGRITASEKNSTALNSILDLRFPWSTSTFLDSLTDSDAVRQRVDYSSPARQRHIFTFVDKNRDMVPNAGEIQPFELPEEPASMNNGVMFYNYLTLYESLPGALGQDLSIPVQRAIDELRRTDPASFDSFQSTLAKRQVDFVRGAEVGNATVCGIPDTVRSRTRNGTTWRLGDIINSAPVPVGSPSEKYNLIYGDKTYEAFARKYAQRRQVIYAGANDGMLHAFNAGLPGGRDTGPESVTDGRTEYPLSMELWAYVPFNLLPHLKWLMRPDYGENLHAAYMDLKPRVFDARIFFGPDGTTPLDNATHPYGWGTVLVAGMRMGGAEIEVDIDKTDGDGFNPAIDRTATSAYVIMDITDPERPPKLLAELTLPRQGFTTCRPAVIPMSSPGATDAASNRWFLVFGSGPADKDGRAASSRLSSTTSEQPGRIFVLDLRALASEGVVATLDATGQATKDATSYAIVEEDTFVSEPVAIDLDLGKPGPGEFKTDIVYFGTVSGTHQDHGGKMWRLLTENQDPSGWAVSTLFDAGQAVTAAPAAALDETGRLWVFFGTGRLFDREDTCQNRNMSFNAIMEPETDGQKTWRTVDPTGLFLTPDSVLADATAQLDNSSEFPGTAISPSAAPASVEDCPSRERQEDSDSGWRIIFPVEGERVLNQATVLGATLLFTSFIPTGTACQPEGDSRLWVTHFTTGTAVCPPPFGRPHDTGPQTFTQLGKGQNAAPAIYLNKTGAAVAFIQTGLGAIRSLTIAPERKTASKVRFWKNNRQ